MKMDKVRDIRNYVLKGDKADTEDREKCSEERALYAETRDGQQKEDWHCDSPYTMGDGAATLLWIISIVAGALFNDRWIIWAVSTMIYVCFRCRHKKKK